MGPKVRATNWMSVFGGARSPDANSVVGLAHGLSRARARASPLFASPRPPRARAPVGKQSVQVLAAERLGARAAEHAHLARIDAVEAEAALLVDGRQVLAEGVAAGGGFARAVVRQHRGRGRRAPPRRPHATF
mgnify:CR=1 FL=1